MRRRAERLTVPGPVEPEGWPRPRGYSNGYAVGNVLFVAGQIGWDAQGRLVEGFLAQFELALRNVRAVVDAAGVPPDRIGRVTIYVTDKRAYLERAREIGRIWREVLGKHFPAMSLVQVADLLEDGALVEIEATAVLPEARP